VWAVSIPSFLRACFQQACSEYLKNKDVREGPTKGEVMQQAQALKEFADKYFVEVGDAKVCYRKVGAGPALVLFHGYPLFSLTWRKIVPELAKHFTCYAFDLVGLGDSTSPNEEDFTSQGEGRVFQQALAALGVFSYALMGNDSGGWVARELALLEPERVTRFVLTNTEIPEQRPPWVWFYQYLAEVPGGSYLFRCMLSLRIWRRSVIGFGSCFENLDLIDGEFFDLFLAPLLATHERIKRALKFLVTMDFRRVDEFKELHGKLIMPVAFVWAADDPAFPEEYARQMATQFPNVAQFTSIPKAKLFMHEEFPEHVLQSVIEFLTSATP
jgi:pimeloyl-ACP methyl ester carboxylesterase